VFAGYRFGNLHDFSGRILTVSEDFQFATQGLPVFPVGLAFQLLFLSKAFFDLTFIPMTCG
jgi:hypothetical protein